MTKREKINNISLEDAIRITKKFAPSFKINMDTPESAIKKVARGIVRRGVVMLILLFIVTLSFAQKASVTINTCIPVSVIPANNYPEISQVFVNTMNSKDTTKHNNTVIIPQLQMPQNTSYENNNKVAANLINKTVDVNVTLKPPRR